MKKILFVDDEPNILYALQRQLHAQFNVETALGPQAGLKALESPADFAVVVADMRMPEMDGIEFLTRVKTIAPDVTRMMLTGNADQATAIHAINEGNIFRFLGKPCPVEKLQEAIKAGIRQHELIIAERELLEKTLSGSINVLTDILSMTEPKSFGHTQLLRDDMRRLGQHLKLPNIWQLEVAALLSNIGHVTIPPEVLLKERDGHSLNPSEREMFLRLPAIGGQLLSQIPRLEDVAKIILYQSKRFDGAGFPVDKIAGHEIPLGARLLKILFDLRELESQDLSRADALNQLRQRAGVYDPHLLEDVAACFQIETPGLLQTVKPPLPLPFAGLRVGHALVSDIQTRDGTLIVSRGNRITPTLIHRLRNFSALSGIREPIYVEAA